ncbi:hypothetical protein LCGC14_0814060 [marine sediment metagenome]|uniref:Uncharacterized protein n=1 Tax=marine sediment metagenome TaxID=412755 RepID=A0A0F9STB2_9ZZZZ
MPGKFVICTIEGCNEDVAKGRLKYCSDSCRKKFARRRHEDGVNIKTTDERVERERQKMRAEEDKKLLKSLARSEAKRELYVSAVQEALSAFKPSTPRPWLIKQDRTTDVDWEIDISDWHVGQSTPQETTGGMYEQTTEIVQKQVDSLLHAMSLIYHEANGKRVKRLWVNIMGDLIENDNMRPSQLREIDLPVVKQTIVAYDLVSYFLRTCLEMPGLEELVVDISGGNHDRTTQKAGNAGLGESDYVDCFSFIIGEFIKRGFEDDPRVSVTNWETFFGTREFGGIRHVFEHGSSIRGSGGSYGGIPFYPIIRAAQQYESMLGGVDMVHFGHLHTPYLLPLGQDGWVVGNGALPATSTFVQSRYKKIRRPQQWLIEFHHSVGATKFEPLYADLGLPKPGDVWKK